MTCWAPTYSTRPSRVESGAAPAAPGMGRPLIDPPSPWITRRPREGAGRESGGAPSEVRQHSRGEEPGALRTGSVGEVHGEPPGSLGNDRAQEVGDLGG